MHVSQGQQRSIVRQQRPNHFGSVRHVSELHPCISAAHPVQHRARQPQVHIVARAQRRRHQLAFTVVQRKGQRMHVRQFANAVGEDRGQAVLIDLASQAFQHVTQASLKRRLFA